MFDDLIRRVNDLGDARRYSVRVPVDAEGYLDRECPSSTCLAVFKVIGDDWETIRKSNVAYCPICRAEAAADQWCTSAQVKQARAAALARFKNEFADTLAEGVRDANRRLPRGGLVSMSLSLQPGTPAVEVPIQAMAPFEQRSACEACGCRYASVGAAFFCPACGHNSAATQFVATIETVRHGMGFLATWQLAQLMGKDQATDFTRQVVETQMGKLVTAFERYVEVLYERLPGPKQPVKGNLFQRITGGSEMWRVATGKGYDDFLTPMQLSDLTRWFQQRHLLTHTDGVVDAEYVTKSGDTSYQIDQRIVVRPEHVIQLAGVIEQLAAELASI
jgi:hypothetical protein